MFFWNSCFFDDPANVGNLTSGSSAFSKTSLNIWKFTVHTFLKPGLENFDHYFPSMWDECNCAVVWAFFGIAFLWNWNENWPFPVLGLSKCEVNKSWGQGKGAVVLAGKDGEWVSDNKQVMERVTENRVRGLTHYQGHGTEFGSSQGDVRSCCMVSGRDATQSEFHFSRITLVAGLKQTEGVWGRTSRSRCGHGAIEVIPGREESRQRRAGQVLGFWKHFGM